MSAPRKKRTLPAPEVLALQKRLRITLTFQEAAQLISFDLNEPEDFTAEVLAVATSDLDVLSDLLERRDPADCLRLFQQLRARLELATRLNTLLKTGGEL